MMKVMYFGGDACIGRSTPEFYQSEFKKNKIDFFCGYSRSKEETDARISLKEDLPKLSNFLNSNEFKWVFFGWEINPPVDVIKKLYELSNTYKILIFGQEVQHKNKLLDKRPYCDIIISDSPCLVMCPKFSKIIDGFLPNCIHSNAVPGIVPCAWDKKEEFILISGSYRNARFQLFERLLKKQPFKWPVRFLSQGNGPGIESCGHGEPINRLLKKYPDFVEKIPANSRAYISDFISLLQCSKIYIDFTINTCRELNICAHKSDIETIFNNLPELARYSYCSERILDAAWMKNYCIALDMLSVRLLLSDTVVYYSSYESLLDVVNKSIDYVDMESKSEEIYKKVWPKYSAENIISIYSHIFHTGKTDKCFNVKGLDA